MIALGTIRKNASEEIRFTMESFKGHEIVNARVWYQDAAGEYAPASKGWPFG